MVHQIRNSLKYIASKDLINVSYNVEGKSEVFVPLIGISNAYEHVIALGSELREPGEYTDGFDVG